MREPVRGYGAAAIDLARRAGSLGGIAAELQSFVVTLDASAELGRALADGAIPLAARRAVVEELLSQRSATLTVRLLSYAVAAEIPAELHGTVAALASRMTDAAAGEALSPEPPASKSASRERVGGYAAAIWPVLAETNALDDVEDELFRFARIVESTPELRRIVADSGTPADLRGEVVAALLADRARPETTLLATYAAQSGRARDLVATLGWLSEQAAAERGRRIAHVRAAVPMRDADRDRLAEALSRMAGMPVQLQVVVDADLVGGASVLVGDTVIDGTVRRRLDQLRDNLINPEQRTTTHG